MDRETRRHVDEYRSSEAGPLENTLIDDLVGGELNRQEFIARASMFGLSLGTVGMLLRHAGMEDLAQAAPQVAGKVGGTIRVGITAFGGSLEPYLLNEGGSLAFAGMPGEYLTFTNPQGRVLPALATSWKANADATVWTFQIRRGVKFHNGKTLTAQDVVASMRQYVREKSSNAGLTPYFDPAGVTARGQYTVVFRLKSPIGVFPYLVSQTTYQAIIQPAAIAAQPGGWVKAGMIGTGPFRVRSYVDKKSAVLVRNDAYWGGRPPLDGVRVTFYQGSAPIVLALRGGQLDLAMQLSPQEGQPFKNNSRFKYYAQPTSAHRQVCMRTDQGPLRDARVRRALALAINRPQQLARVMLGAGQIGNDTPFWRGFVSTDRVGPAAHAEPQPRAVAAAGSGRREPEVQPDDVELPRPRRSRRVPAGLRARDRDRHGNRGHGLVEVLRRRARRCRLRHDDPVAQPHRDTDRVRRARRAERLCHPLLHVHGRLERVALQEHRSSTRRPAPTWLRRRSLPSAGRPRRCPASCSATRR